MNVFFKSLAFTLCILGASDGFSTCIDYSNQCLLTSESDFARENFDSFVFGIWYRTAEGEENNVKHFEKLRESIDKGAPFLTAPYETKKFKIFVVTNQREFYSLLVGAYGSSQVLCCLIDPITEELASEEKVKKINWCSELLSKTNCVITIHE